MENKQIEEGELSPRVTSEEIDGLLFMDDFDELVEKRRYSNRIAGLLSEILEDSESEYSLKKDLPLFVRNIMNGISQTTRVMGIDSEKLFKEIVNQAREEIE